MLLSDLVDDYCTSTKNNSFAANTVRLRTRVARKFLAHVGNIQVHNVTDTHVDRYFIDRSAVAGPSTLNLELTLLRALWKYAMVRKAAKHDPFYHRRPFRATPPPRQRVPRHDFGRLLDACEHPRDRLLIAIGIYTGLRQSEIVPLRLGQVDMQEGYLRDVQIVKSAKVDDVPIPLELDGELRTWLTYYTNEVGPLHPDYLLVPAKSSPSLTGRVEVDRASVRLRPRSRMSHPERVVQRALVACGYITSDDDGTTREGIHTLRRSFGRALFDTLSAQGHDQALRVVQSALHHSSQATTERYLGVEVDKRKRDDIIRGKAMFAADEVNVVKLERRAER